MNIIDAYPREGVPFRTKPLYQYDYGQAIRLHISDLPASYKVEFSNSTRADAILTVQTTDEVVVPAEVLVSGNTVYSWVVVVGEDERTTEYALKTPVIARAKPTDQEPTPEEQSEIDQAIAALNTGVERAEEIADSIPDTIEDALEAAKESGAFDGPPGPQGEKGDTGERGPQGEKGDTGERGPQGEKGDTGERGPQGEKGDTGEQGAQGVQGVQGVQGPAGLQGPQGIPGQDGYSPTVAVTRTVSGAMISITDKQGTTTARVYDGFSGVDGRPGQDGFSPVVDVVNITGGHRVTIADASSVHTFDVMDGTDGQPGEQGADGVSPAATVSKSGNVATITIIDKNGTTTAQISDGAKGETGATGPKGDTGAQGVQGPKGDTGDKGDQGPKGDKGDTGAQGAKGDPGDDYVLTAQDKADIAGMVDVPVTDVQVNGTSILSNGVANLPVASNTNFGVAKVSSGYYGVGINSNNQLTTIAATVSEIKGVSQDYKPITASYISPATFYGLAKAAGDTTQSASSNAVGNYTESAKSAIGEMLGGSVSVSGTTPTIVAKAGIRYVCGEVSTLDFTPSATGICDVVFASGSTPAVLTVPNTVKWPAWFDPTSLEANTTYELNVMNGTLGAVGVWT